MAEYLLLKFEDEETRLEVLSLMATVSEPQVIAVYRAPTAFCECGSTAGKALKSRGWTKGRKWGWWVCDMCGSMSKLAHTNAIRSEAFGYNLLDSTIDRLRD